MSIVTPETGTGRVAVSVSDPKPVGILSEEVANHLGLVGKVAMIFTNCYPIEDTEEFSDGCLGLIRARERFNPNRGVKFSSYAFDLIYQAIIQGHRSRQRGRRENLMGDLDSTLIFEKVESHHELVESMFADHVDDTYRNKKDKQILWLFFFGGEDGRGLTYAQIGRSKGLTREAVRIAADRAIRLLQERYNCEY